MMSRGQAYHNASTTASNLLDYNSEKSNYLIKFCLYHIEITNKSCGRRIYVGAAIWQLHALSRLVESVGAQCMEQLSNNYLTCFGRFQDIAIQLKFFILVFSFY